MYREIFFLQRIKKLSQVCDRSYDCPKYEAEDEGEEEENCDTGEAL